jgi:hypothetical protein
MVENKRRNITNKYALSLDSCTLNRRAVLISVKEDI